MKKLELMQLYMDFLSMFSLRSTDFAVDTGAMDVLTGDATDVATLDVYLPGKLFYLVNDVLLDSPEINGTIRCFGPPDTEEPERIISIQGVQCALDSFVPIKKPTLH